MAFEGICFVKYPPYVQSLRQNLYRAERDVGRYHIKRTVFQFLPVYRLKTADDRLCVGLQG